MIKKLYLQNFRSYRQLDLAVAHPVNLFVGRNGQGKTNLLEAIFFVSMLRSFRTSQLRDLKSIGQKGFMIGAEIDHPGGWSERLEIDYIDQKRHLKIDGNPVYKASEFIKKIKTVVFSPDDINIITGNSANRRRFFDVLISLLEPEYLTSLQNYAIALRSRNAVLRDLRRDRNLAKAYEPILAHEGTVITAFRSEYCEVLTVVMEKLLSRFYQESADFKIKYRPPAPLYAELDFLERFDQERERDFKRGFSNFGPQLDDFDFLLKNKLMRNYGSNGQCRLAALGLKMGSVDILSGREERNNIAVLVDDVTGDLDPVVKQGFLQTIDHAGQAFFTFTEIPGETYFKEAAVYLVNEGNIEKNGGKV